VSDDRAIPSIERNRLVVTLVRRVCSLQAQLKTGGKVGFTIKFNGLDIADGGLTISSEGIGINGGLPP
jgi:hypothetical protein